MCNSTLLFDIANRVVLNFQGNFVNLLKKQQASRLCQFYLPNTSLDVVNLIYQEIKSSLPELLFDSYGNYFCKKLFFYLPSHLRIDYLYTIQSYIPQLAMNKISTSSIQGIISNLNTNQEQSIAVASVIRDLSTLCLDVFGSGVLQVGGSLPGGLYLKSGKEVDGRRGDFLQ